MMTLTTTSTAMTDDGLMDSRSGPRAGGPSRRRAFSPAQKIAYLRGYEQARAAGDGSGYLRREGLYSSLISTWRRDRDAGLLTATSEGPVGRPSAEQAEIARLRRELEVTQSKLSTTRTALDIMGKARELLESISKSSEADEKRGRR